MFKHTGSSFDLKNIREYGPGDDPRRIDWKLMGRTDRLFVKDFYAEEQDGVCILVDLSGSMAVFGLEETVTISASVAWMLSALGLPTSLWGFAEGIERRLERPRGGVSSAPIQAFFQNLEAAGRTSLMAVLPAIRKACRYRKVVIVSDFLDLSFRPASVPFSRTFFLRLHRDFETLQTGFSEINVIDPETHRRLRSPWDRLAREAYRQREATLDGVLCSNRHGWYRKLAPGADRTALYWSLLEAIHG
jgi:uncharacterized protein (DUF58 family)